MFNNDVIGARVGEGVAAFQGNGVIGRVDFVDDVLGETLGRDAELQNGSVLVLTLYIFYFFDADEETKYLRY